MPTTLSHRPIHWAFAALAALSLGACGGSTSKDGTGTGGTAGSGGGGGVTCTYGGKTYQPGDSFPADDGCNTCSCGTDGTVGCTLMWCATGCDYNGQHYEPGDSFPAGDGCNTCSCDGTGGVLCTEMACPAACVYGGKPYGVGETFPSLDGCNSCTCTAPKVVSCTTKACACDPAKEWWRSYVATDPAKCAVIDYACPPNTTGFENQCGCGCQQDASCPQFIDCMPPTDCTDLVEKCPYSGVAY